MAPPCVMTHQLRAPANVLGPEPSHCMPRPYCVCMSNTCAHTHPLPCPALHMAHMSLVRPALCHASAVTAILHSVFACFHAVMVAAGDLRGGRALAALANTLRGLPALSHVDICLTRASRWAASWPRRVPAQSRAMPIDRGHVQTGVDFLCVCVHYFLCTPYYTPCIIFYAPPPEDKPSSEPASL